MNRRIVLWVLLANLAALLALSLIYPHLMISPGPLIDGHRELATDCFACHTPWQGSSPGKCVTCHKPEEIGRLDTKGRPIVVAKTKTAFHQKLVEQDCVACHSDHRGVMPYRTIRTFSHALLGKAVQEGCTNCHQAPADKLHRGMTGECSQCHSQDAWKPATFDHDKFFRFDRHHETDCATCHPRNDFKQYTCYGCHEHSRGKIREEHLEEGINDYEKCVECHRSGDEDEAKSAWRGKQGGERSQRRERNGHDDD